MVRWRDPGRRKKRNKTHNVTLWISWAVIVLSLVTLVAWINLDTSLSSHFGRPNHRRDIPFRWPSNDATIRQDQESRDKSRQRHVKKRPIVGKLPPLHYELHRSSHNNSSPALARHIQDLPRWIQEYLIWHQRQLHSIFQSTTSDISLKENSGETNHTFLVMRCHDLDTKCGGLADRLQSVPFFIRMAAKHQRILLITWSRPCRLEEFLIPPIGGLNWSVPAIFIDSIARVKVTDTSIVNEGQPNQRQLYFSSAKHLVNALQQTDYAQEPIVVGVIQYERGMDSYFFNTTPEDSLSRTLEAKNDVIPYHVYRDLFAVLFEPAPPVQERIRQWQPSRQYAAAHLRADYGNQPIPEMKLQAAAINAIHCASNLVSPKTPVMFLSDRQRAVEYVAQYQRETGGNYVPVSRSYNPLHLDKASAGGNHDPTAYYDAFVDLWLLAQAECVAYGRGGFGRLGSLLTRNSTCSMTFYHKGSYVSCLS